MEAVNVTDFPIRDHKGILTKDLGTILVGGQAVEEGLIDSIGGIHEAFAKLHQLIQETKSGGKKSF
jgi:ClpP class serine protease